MRPNNQNKRSRGRSSGGRKHGNPLSRNYESNGPEVRVRGNAANVAEKYVQLARDAHSAGDSVMEQSFLQHAEHYSRIVSAAQAHNLQRQERQNAESQQPDSGVTPSADESSSAPAEKKPETDGEAAQNVRKPRERRPRRQPAAKKPAASEATSDADAAKTDEASSDAHQDKAPQPEIDGLPAFLTNGGGKTDAAE